MVFQDTIKLAPQQKGATDITEIVNGLVRDAQIRNGICQLFVHNNHSSLLIADTADENTKNMTQEYLAMLAPSNDSTNRQIDASMNAIPTRMRTALMQTSISFPIRNSRAALGAWQGIYLWEQAGQPDERNLTITIVGE
jgi:secondary thiamine-phosphate synthase enzyme